MPAYKVQKRPRKPGIKQRSQGIYSPLDSKRHEFRILVLRPGPYDKPLRGYLKIIRFPESGKKKGSGTFETVSYVWGDKTARASITVTGQTLDIPASAVSALKCMRYRHGERTLWIDSICINQEDLQERAQQVSMMAEIFGWAHTNLIHLGDDDGKAKSAIDSIDRIAREIEEEIGGVMFRDFVFYKDMRFKRSTNPLTSDPDFDALVWLFDRPWFRYVSLIAISGHHTNNRWIADSG